jgi:hypothetical protein
MTRALLAAGGLADDRPEPGRLMAARVGAGLHLIATHGSGWLVGL